MYRVLVPLDGSEFAEQALPFAETLGAHGAELVLTQVVLAVAAGRRGSEAQRLRSMQTAERYLQRLERYYSGRWLATQRVVRYGDAAEQLIEAAAAVEADLIVMASHGRSGLTRWALGSVTDRVVRTAPCPVLVVRAVAPPLWTGAPPSFSRVLVPLDGSELAETTLRELEPWYGEVIKDVLLVRVTDPGAPGDPAALQREARAYLTSVGDRIAASGVRVTPIVRSGEASAVIADCAAEQQADAIALSSHGRSGLERWLLGSVAQRVIERSPLPVLVARQGMAPAHPFRDAAEAQANGRCANCGRLVYDDAAALTAEARCLRCGFHLHTCANCAYFEDARCVLGRAEAGEAVPGQHCPAFAWRKP